MAGRLRMRWGTPALPVRIIIISVKARTQSMSMPSSPYEETMLASLAMNVPRLAEELIVDEKYWQPPHPPIESTIFVPFPLFLAAATRRLSKLVVLESQSRPREELGIANAM